MSVNISNFVKKQSKLVTKKSTKRVAKLDLTKKSIRGSVKLHIVPDTNGLPMLTTKNVFEVHQTETYTYQDEVRTRYPVFTIPNSNNYNIVDGAVMPTDMQLKKLDKLNELLASYAELSNPYQTGGPKLDSSKTETSLWVKNIGTYTKFWAKIAELTPSNPGEGKQPDFDNIVMVSHGSANFVKAFNKWATPDSDSEISVEDQLKKIEDAVSDEPGDALRCVKIETTKAAIGYDVEIKNLKIDNASVQLTQEDLAEATPLISEDWDYTVFDDEKVDTLTARLEKYLEGYDLNASEEDEESEDDNSEEEDSDNPFADED